MPPNRPFSPSLRSPSLRRPVRAGALALGLCLGLQGGVDAAPALSLTLTQRIRALEADGRSHPREAGDALEQLLPATAESSPERLELLTVEGVILAVASIDDGARRNAERLEAWGRDRALPRADVAAAAGQLVRAQILIRSGELTQADALLGTAISHLPAELGPVDRYRFVHAQANVATEAGRLEDAVRLNHDAVGLADRQDALWRRSEARTRLGYSYYRARQYERAARLAADAIALSEKAQDWISLARAHNTAAIAADGLHDPAGERRGFEAAIAYARRADSKIDEVRFLANLADFFLQTADYPTALHHASLALPLARALRDRNTESVAQTNLGLAQISMGQREAGMRNVLAAIAIDEKRGSAIGVADGWRNAAIYLERAGHLSEAIDAYHRHRRFITEVLRGDQQKAILAMQEQYDADDRTRALTLLNREAAIQAEQLQRRGLLRWLGGLLTLAFLLSFVAGTLLYRRVRTTNRALARSNALLKVQGERDPLTDLANRRHFQAVLRERSPDGRLEGTALLLDIDHFKSINDLLGHAAGDAVLIEVARRLRETLRDEDLLVRWGGEEFLLLVRGLQPAQVVHLVQRLLAALQGRPVEVDGVAVEVTGSIGFATFPLGAAARAVSCDQAINLVDAAMYLAKAAGRHRACGVIGLAPDGAALEAALADLASAARDGRASLSWLQGADSAPPVGEAPRGATLASGETLASAP